MSDPASICKILTCAQFNGQRDPPTSDPASILYKSTAGRYRPISYPDGPITARYIELCKMLTCA